MDDRPTTHSPALSVGDTLTLTPTTMAHGGEAIAHAPDGRVVFVAGAIPGDTASVALTKVKKNWARGEAQAIDTPSPDRVDPACPAAEAGAGCCDYSHITPTAQERLKREVLVGQLDKFARPSGVLTGFDLAIDLEQDTLAPLAGWRTRVRLGVDSDGRAGMRRARSHDVIAGVRCTQVNQEALDGIVGADARRFTPGAELVVVVDSRGTRHVVETQRAQRGKRIERIETRIEGDSVVTEAVPAPQSSGIEESVFRFPPTAFWQAHTTAPATYCRYIADWAADTYARPVGWDLYGGVGLFVPSISDALGQARTWSASIIRRRRRAIRNRRWRMSTWKCATARSSRASTGCPIRGWLSSTRRAQVPARMSWRLSLHAGRSASFTSVAIPRRFRATSQRGAGAGT